MQSENKQKITRLTPFAEAMALLDELARPVTPREMPSADAIGYVLAADVVSRSLPARATALNDGWAVKADELADASGYAPAPLRTKPAWVEAGDELPAAADSVAPADIIVTCGDAAEAVGAVTQGEGVAVPGSEVDAAKPLRASGTRIRAIDVAVLEAAGIDRVSVRVPRMLVVAAREDLRLQPALRFIAKDCSARGGEIAIRSGVELEDALAAADADAIVAVGGSGNGRRDRSVQTLARAGELAAHGIALTPGETAALGQVGSRPVLIVPGQLDGGLAAWLTLGRTMLARLAGQTEIEIPATLTLSRKITSTIGMTELVPVRHDGTQTEPLATRHLSLSMLANANGWLLVPPDSEGFPAGAKVAIYNLP